MKKSLYAVGKSLSLLKTDKTLLFVSLFPIIIGIAIYMALGGFALAEAVSSSKEWILSFFAADSFIVDIALSLVAGTVLSILYFFASYVVILLVSIFSCVFNDIISSKAESLLIDGEVLSLQKCFRNIFTKAGSILFNETKKISFIAILGLIAFVLSFTAVLLPLSLVISWILVAIQFLDYSWCRHDFTFAECIGDLRANFIAYTLSAIVFSFAFSLPFVGLLFIPLAIIHFTVLFVDKQISEGSENE